MGQYYEIPDRFLSFQQLRNILRFSFQQMHFKIEQFYPESKATREQKEVELELFQLWNQLLEAFLGKFTSVFLKDGFRDEDIEVIISGIHSHSNFTFSILHRVPLSVSYV